MASRESTLPGFLVTALYRSLSEFGSVMDFVLATWTESWLTQQFKHCCGSLSYSVWVVGVSGPQHVSNCANLATPVAITAAVCHHRAPARMAQCKDCCSNAASYRRPLEAPCTRHCTHHGYFLGPALS